MHTGPRAVLFSFILRLTTHAHSTEVSTHAGSRAQTNVTGHPRGVGLEYGFQGFTDSIVVLEDCKELVQESKR